MTSLLRRKLIVVTGKGGTGKTTVTAALGLLAAREGRRVVLVEMSGQQLLPGLLRGEAEATRSSSTGNAAEIQLGEGLWCTSIDPDQTLLDWLGEVGGRLPARLLAARDSFRYFAAAAPGGKELLSLVRIWELTQEERWGRHDGAYDLAIVDAPATGHALAMLSSPATFGAIARVGPIATQAADVGELLSDPERTGYLAVAQASEASISETLELAGGLEADLGRELDRVIVNGTLVQRFTRAEIDQLERLEGGPEVQAAIAAARLVDERARRQRNQVARLRRARLPVLTLPFVFRPRLARGDLEAMSARLGRGLRAGLPAAP